MASSTTDTSTTPGAALPPASVWRLQSGDHMDRATFHQRYLAMPPGFQAELID
jgi:hypothetical protein